MPGDGIGGQPAQVRDIRVGSIDAFRGERGEQAAHQQGVAAGQLVAGVPEGRRRGSAERRGDQPRTAVRAERRRPHRHRVGLRGQGGDQRLGVRGPRPRLAHRDREQYRETVQPARQVRHEPLRRRVRPVQVVDRQQQRRPVRDVGRHPVQTVQHREGVLIARPHGMDQRLRGQRDRVVPWAGGPQLRLEQLPDDAPGVAVLVFGGPRGQDGHPGVGRVLAGVCEQPGLADPGGALHQQHRTGPSTRSADRRSDDV